MLITYCILYYVLYCICIDLRVKNTIIYCLHIVCGHLAKFLVGAKNSLQHLAYFVHVVGINFTMVYYALQLILCFVELILLWYIMLCGVRINPHHQIIKIDTVVFKYYI